jgi:hypothetical protein
LSADTITISTGPVLASEDLRAIRGMAIGGLFGLFDQSPSPVEKRELFSALTAATYLPIQANYSNDLCAIVLGDTKRIVDTLAERVGGMPYDLLEHVEYQFMRRYTIARQIAEDEEDKFRSKGIAEDLVKSILAFRDSLNRDEQFVRYKTLVGFESIFSPHWENDNFEFEGAEAYRRERATKYVDVISDATEDEWYQLVAPVRSWFRADDPLFRFHGGRLLAAVFRAFPDELAKLLSDTAANGSDDDFGFILGILQNYKGEPATHVLLKALVNRRPEDDRRFVEIEICLQNTGVVGGEFGFVQAFRRKKAEMASWLEDDRPPVKTFAKEYTRKLDGRIASEQRSAEHSKELRNRAFEEVHEE